MTNIFKALERAKTLRAAPVITTRPLAAGVRTNVARQSVMLASPAFVREMETLAQKLWGMYEDQLPATILVCGCTADADEEVSKVARSLAMQLTHYQRDVLLCMQEADLGMELGLLPANSRTWGSKASTTEFPHLYYSDLGASKANPWALTDKSDLKSRLISVGEETPFVIVDAALLRSGGPGAFPYGAFTGVLLVVAAERTPRKSVLATVAAIEEAEGETIGVVFSGRRYRIPSWLYRFLQ